MSCEMIKEKDVRECKDNMRITYVVLSDSRGTPSEGAGQKSSVSQRIAVRHRSQDMLVLSLAEDWIAKCRLSQGLGKTSGIWQKLS